MKPYIVIIISVVVGFIYGIATVQYQLFPFELIVKAQQLLTPTKSSSPPRPNHNNYYYHKKSFFEQHGRNGYDVAFVGDSITDGAEWEDLFPSLTIANRGIDADTTDGVLKRLDSVYSTNTDTVFIMIGVNDIFRGKSVEHVFNNYKTIVANLASRKVKVYIQSTLLVGKKREAFNLNIKNLNTRLELLAKQSDLVTFIDLNAGLALNGLLNPNYSRDGVHLNAEGYTAWKESISHYIQPQPRLK